MANNPYVNRVETADGSTLMDITDTTAEPSSVGLGEVFYAASGERSVGTFDPSLSKTISTPAAVQSFSDGAAYPMKMEITVDPVQAGSGDPSPSNVRPITGWTGTNVSVSPTQDAQDATVYPITFPTSAGTVYGGTLTVNADGTGELVVDRAITTLNGTESWHQDSNTQRGYYVALHVMKKMLDYTDNIICDKLKTFENYSHNDYLAAVNGITGYPDPTTIYDGRNWVYVKANEISTLENFKTWLGSNNLNVVYTLADPITYTLSAPQVLSLLGQNNVWADTGNINELTYIRENVPEILRDDVKGQIALVQEKIGDVGSTDLQTQIDSIKQTIQAGFTWGNIAGVS